MVLRGAALGDPRIVVRAVTADHRGPLLGGARSGAVPDPPGAARRSSSPRARSRRSGPRPHRPRLRRRHRATARRRAPRGAAPDRGRHVAVLVGMEPGRAGRNAPSPNAASRPSSVAAASCSPRPRAPSGWRLLEALEQPHRSGRVRAAGLTAFVGRSLAELDDGGEALTDASRRPAARLGAAAARARGGRLYEATEEQGLTARVLGDDRRRAAADRPAPCRTDAPRDGRARRARADRAPRVAAVRARGGVAGAGTPARQRCGCGADHDAAPEQGAAVPRGPPALRLTEGRLDVRSHALPRRDDTRTLDVSGVGPAVARPCRGPSARGGRGGAARPLRLAHPGPVAGRHLVGADVRTPRRRPPPAALRPPAGAGRGARRARTMQATTTTSRGCSACSPARWAGPELSVVPEVTSDVGDRTASGGWPRVTSSARSTPSGGVPPTPG